MIPVLIRGGGDLATGIAIRLLRCGIQVAITELAQPLAVRRSVSFSEAIYEGEIIVEGFTARCFQSPPSAQSIRRFMQGGEVPVIVDPECTSAQFLCPSIIVDARMSKKPPGSIAYVPNMLIGLGPGFTAGQNCQAVIETRRSHFLGRVIWQGAASPDTGQPEGDPSRVIRAPGTGELTALHEIGRIVEENATLAEIRSTSQTIPVKAPFRGLLRGLIRSGLLVEEGMKIGDIDRRLDENLCLHVSDKSLAISGGVLEAVLSRPEIRSTLWS